MAFLAVTMTVLMSHVGVTIDAAVGGAGKAEILVTGAAVDVLVLAKQGVLRAVNHVLDRPPVVCRMALLTSPLTVVLHAVTLHAVRASCAGVPVLWVAAGTGLVGMRARSRPDGVVVEA